MGISILLLFVGFGLIIFGSDMFIDKTVWIAKIFKIPNIIIGATLVSFGTTLPEVMVSTTSALRQNTEIAFGNAVGSIAVNTGFILALTIILTAPNLKDKKSIIKSGSFLIFLVLLLIGFSYFFGELGIYAGVTLLVLLAGYVYYNVKDAKASAKEIIEDEQLDKSPKTVVINIILFIVGLTLTIVGANLLVVHGEKIARYLGVSDIVIGLTLTAFGTSLPELVTALTAVFKGVHDISIGNVLGANVLNILLVLGISSNIYPIPTPSSYFTLHIPYVLVLTILVVGFSIFNKEKLKRWNGAIILASYAGYLYLLFR